MDYGPVIAVAGTLVTLLGAAVLWLALDRKNLIRHIRGIAKQRDDYRTECWHRGEMLNACRRALPDPVWAGIVQVSSAERMQVEESGEIPEEDFKP